jgi:hypothetical protein
MWKHASTRWRVVRGARRTRSRSFRAVWTVPFAQRYCCARNALGRNLRGRHDVGPVHEPPPAQLSAVGQVEILGERVVLPPAGIGNCGPAPDPASAGKIEHASGAEPRAVLHEMVTVEHERLHAREQALLTVQMPPTRLHHADRWVAEITDDGAEKIRLGNEVRVEDGDELALGALQPELECAGLVPGPVTATQVHRVEPAVAELENLAARQSLGFVGRVVEDLDLEPLSRVVEPRDCIEQPLDHRRFVVERKLNGDGRQVGRRKLWNGAIGAFQLPPEPDAEPNQVGAVNAVGTQKEQNGEIGEQKYGHTRPFSNIHAPDELSSECNSLHALVLTQKTNVIRQLHKLVRPR